MNSYETTAASWSQADEQFFRIAAELFSPSFLAGAGVLLASYDAEPITGESRPASVAGATAERSTTTATAGVSRTTTGG